MNSNDEDDMEMLFESIHTLYTTYKQYNGLTRALTSRERKYLIMGFALHLIGDIYAHRGCVPSIYASDSYFNSYINNNGYIKASKISQLKSLIGQGNFYCTKFYNNNENNSYIDMDAVHEDHPDWSGNDVFEDNIDFIPQRYYISMMSAQNFVSEILISGNTFHASDIVLDNHYFIYSLPNNPNNNIPLKLYNYTTYLNDL